MGKKANVRARLIAGALCAVVATSAGALEIVGESESDTRLSLNADFVSAGFVGSDSWFGASEEFLGGETDDWLEIGIEPMLSFRTPLGKGSLVAKLSGVYTKTYGDDASGLTIGLGDAGDFTAEQANIGWTATDLFAGLEDDEFSITLGRQDYRIGTGMIILDGGGDGAERGGWYIGMRKAFDDAVIARLKTKKWLLEGFHLENDPRAGGVEGRADGVNLEYTFPDVALGASYLDVDPKLPDTDSLDVFSGRVDWGGERPLHLRAEYVTEQSDEIDADGWYAEVEYGLKSARWSPVLTYRYAHFDGDDPLTADDEQFREIAYGYTDYGYWYQGEIAGNYPLGNGNVESQMLRAKLQPAEAITVSLLYYRFTLDEPAALDPAVTDDHFGDEIDVTLDWQATDSIYVIGVLGALLPGDAAEQWTGGDDDWLYAMLYLSYAW